MEKNAGKSKRFRHRRLLAWCALAGCLLHSGVYAAPTKAPTAEQIRALVIKSENEVCFTAQDSLFTLEIPGIDASKLQVELGSLPPNIQFQSSRRDVYFDDESLQSGARLQLYFSFSETGTITIPPLSVTIANRRYKIPFQTVTVYENLETLAPKLSVEFTEDVQNRIDKNGTLHIPAGTEVRFTVSLSFCVQLVKFNWRLPKNAIFREVSREAIADGAFFGKTFSPDVHTLAVFSWTPLAEGISALPDIAVTAVAYNGMKKTVSIPLMAVSVEKPTLTAASESTQQSQQGLFSDAFSEQVSEMTTEQAEEPFAVDCAYLARLRSAERHSTPFDKSRKERIAYEAKAAISTPPEARLCMAQLFYALFFLALVCAVILCIQKHIKRATVSAAIGVLILLACIHWTYMLSPTHAIFAGGEIRSIPEENATSARTEPAGQRVRILEKADIWMYIATTESGGWVKADTLYPIR